jgi:hypothetical protein
MRNLLGPKWIISHQVKKWWTCFDQSPSGILLVVLPDYLPEYCGYVLLKILYSKRGYCERKKRKLQWVCCRLYPFICCVITP